MISSILNKILEFISGINIYAPIMACFLITIESMIPVLPLCAFITVNFLYFGEIIGFIISWFFTCIGSTISYLICKNGLSTLKNKDNKINKYLKNINKLSTQRLTVLIAMPFTPAFLINIAAGYTQMKFKKYIIAILIGKIFMVYFWGYIGTSFIESITHPIIIIKILIMLILSFIISYFIKKIFKLD